MKPKKQRDELEGDSKPKIDSKADYIHVRARRGQATDSHSLAERVGYLPNCPSFVLTIYIHPHNHHFLLIFTSGTTGENKKEDARFARFGARV